MPVVFEGDLTDEEGILSWLTSQEVFEIADEIEEVNRKMLEKILEENEFVAAKSTNWMLTDSFACLKISRCQPLVSGFFTPLTKNM